MTQTEAHTASETTTDDINRFKFRISWLKASVIHSIYEVQRNGGQSSNMSKTGLRSALVRREPYS